MSPLCCQWRTLWSLLEKIKDCWDARNGQEKTKLSGGQNVGTKQQMIQTSWGGRKCERTNSRCWQRPSGPTQHHSCFTRAWFWDRTLHFGDKSWNSEHTVLKKPIQPDEPKVPDNSWRSWRRHTQCERSCSSPQQHGRTRIIQVPLPNYLSDKKCKCIRDSVKCNSRCHKNRSCHNPLFPLKFWNSHIS